MIFSQLHEFHFLRPLGLLTLLLVPLIWYLISQHTEKAGNWSGIISENLLPHLLVSHGQKTNNFFSMLLLAAFTIASFALSGPTFQKLPQAQITDTKASVIVLALSPTMNATDISPTRLERAKLKIRDFLGLNEDGQIALVVYAGGAHVVTPLTQDKKTIENLLSVVETSIMPIPGDRADLGLEKAKELLNPVQGGHIILIADSLGDAISGTDNKRDKISVLGVGTKDGGPVLLEDGQFLKDSSGQTKIASIDELTLRELANQHGGVYTALTAGDTDVRELSAAGLSYGTSSVQNNNNYDTWLDFGYYLVWLILPVALLFFRRGALQALFVFLLFTGIPRAHASFWKDLWQTKDQQGAAILEDDPKTASQLFESDEWRAHSQYKAGKFEEAAKTFAQLDGADAHYNRGNSFAQMGKIEEAILAYESALNIDPAHEDAAFNKDLLEKLKKEQQQNQNQDKNQDKNQDESQEQDSEKQDSKNSQESQENSKESKQEQNQNSQDSSNSQTDKQMSQSEKEELEEQAKKESEKQEGKQEQSQKREPSDADKSEEGQDAIQNVFEQKNQSNSDSADEKKLKRLIEKIEDDPAGLLRRKFYLQSQIERQKEGK